MNILIRLLKMMFTFEDPDISGVRNMVRKIESQRHIANHGLTSIDIVNGTSFKVGRSKFGLQFFSHPDSLFMHVLFGHKDTNVAIKYNDDVVFYSSESDEVAQIRKAIKTCYENMEERMKVANHENFEKLF